MEDLVEYNHTAWNREAREGYRWSVPAGAEEIRMLRKGGEQLSEFMSPAFSLRPGSIESGRVDGHSALAAILGCSGSFVLRAEKPINEWFKSTVITRARKVE